MIVQLSWMANVGELPEATFTARAMIRGGTLRLAWVSYASWPRRLCSPYLDARAYGEPSELPHKRSTQ